MGEVASIHGGPTGERVRNDKCVERLRQVLEMAESGEVVSVAVIHLNSDGTAGFGVGGDHVTMTMIGAAHAQAHDMTSWIVEG